MPDTIEPRKRRSPIKANEGLQLIAYRDGKLKVSCKTPKSVRTVEIEFPKGCSQEELYNGFLALAEEYKPAEAEQPPQSEQKPLL